MKTSITFVGSSALLGWLSCLVLGAAVIANISACSMVQNTKDMKKTTEEMRDTSNKIEKQSHDLAVDTKYLRGDLTAKESFLMVTANLDRVFGVRSFDRTDFV